MAQKHQQTGMERRFVIYPQTIRSENTPFASGSQRNRHRIALSGKRCLAGNFASPTISQRTCFYLYTTEIANHSGRQSDRNKIARLQQRLGSFPPAQKRILRFHSGYRRRHHRRRYVQGPAQNAATIKVGYVSETARYNLPSQEQVLPLLQTLVNISGESSTNDKVRKGLNSALHFFKELLNLK